MNEKLNIRLPSELLESPNINNLELLLKNVQEYFDDIELDLDEDSISFFFVQGDYSHINRSTTITGVFISTLPIAALAFRGIVTLQHAESEEEVAEIEVAFPNSFIGEFLPHEGILTQFTLPTSGLAKDTILETTEVISRFSDIEYVAFDSDDNSMHAG